MPPVLAHEDAESVAACGLDPARLKAVCQTHGSVNVILGREENGSPGEVGWRTVELLDAAYRSAAVNGAVVDVAALYA